MRKLIEHLQAIASHHGATLTHVETLRPLCIEKNARHGDFSRGVLATVAEVYALVGESPEGWQAIRDLGFQPFLQRVEGK